MLDFKLLLDPVFPEGTYILSNIMLRDLLMEPRCINKLLFR